MDHINGGIPEFGNQPSIAEGGLPAFRRQSPAEVIPKKGHRASHLNGHDLSPPNFSTSYVEES